MFNHRLALAATVTAVCLLPLGAQSQNIPAQNATYTRASQSINAKDYTPACQSFGELYAASGHFASLSSAVRDAAARSRLSGDQLMATATDAARDNDIAKACAFSYLAGLVFVSEGKAAQAMGAGNAGSVMQQNLAPGASPAASRGTSAGTSADGAMSDAPPHGQYKCYSGPYATFLAGAQVGSVAFTPGAFQGYLWIFDAHHYANVKEDDRGTYDMRGDKLVAQNGPWQRNNMIVRYAAKGLYGRPTVVIGFADTPGLTAACVLM